MNAEAQRRRGQNAENKKGRRMPYEEEYPPLYEPDEALNALSHAVIGAAIEVHKRLGPGLDEHLYREAMCVELTLRGIRYSKEVEVVVEYKGHPIGKKRLDFVIEGKLIIELKAVEQLSPLHKAQLLTYLKITHLKLGLLINFNVEILKDGLKRVIRP
jgi:GxxExxY protein